MIIHIHIKICFVSIYLLSIFLLTFLSIYPTVKVSYLSWRRPPPFCLRAKRFISPILSAQLVVSAGMRERAYEKVNGIGFCPFE